MFLVTAEQMKRIDRTAIEGRGIPSSTLMENAGRAAFDVLRRHVADLRSKRVAVVCGPGNNGGDGRIVARLLEGVAKQADVIDSGASGSECQTILQSADVIVDAIFGIGLSRPVSGREKDLIIAINESQKWVLAIDIPSGLSADTGRPLGVAVRADVTVTMALPKIGLVLPEASPYVGCLELADIGIPKDIAGSLNIKNHWVTDEDLRREFSARSLETHKGTYGHALLVGGSETKAGAILMSGRAALRAGAGLVTVALPDRAFRKLSKNFLELMYAPEPSVRSGTFSKTALSKIIKLLDGKKAVGIGPGMGTAADSRAVVKGLIKKTSLPMVIDADGLNNMTPSDLREGLILTPHPGEMARLIDKSTAFVSKKRVEIARSFAAKHRVFLVLKGFRTLTATPEGHLYVNSTGNPGMATAGMGDVLTGLIVSLLAQGMPSRDAVVAGVWLHGRAGDRVAARLGDRGLLATDVIDEIPLAIRELVS